MKAITICMVFSLIASGSVFPYDDCNYAKALLSKVQISNQTEKITQLQHLAERALKLCSNEADIYFFIGSILDEQGEANKAITYYRKSIDLNSHFTEAWYKLSQIYEKQQRCILALEANLHACQMRKEAKERAHELLSNQCLISTEKNVIVDRESLLVIFDAHRREKWERLIESCGLKATATLSIRPVHTFFNLAFEFNTTVLLEAADKQLKEIALAIMSLPLEEYKVFVHGHSDPSLFASASEKESAKLNFELSRERALFIVHALEARGMTKGYLQIKPHGANNLLVPNYSNEDMEKNRRIDIEVELKHRFEKRLYPKYGKSTQK